MTGDGSIPVGVTDARAIFDGNMSGITGYTLNSVTPAVAKAGMVDHLDGELSRPMSRRYFSASWARAR